MTRIEQFNRAKLVADRLRRAVNQILCRDSPQNDKGHMTVTFTGLSKADWSPMQFQVHASHGYYGSSSGYSDTSPELGEYLAKAIANNRVQLLDEAVRLAAIDAEIARKAAEDEAKAILQETVA